MFDILLEKKKKKKAVIGAALSSIHCNVCSSGTTCSNIPDVLMVALHSFLHNSNQLKLEMLVTVCT